MLQFAVLKLHVAKNTFLPLLFHLPVTKIIGFPSIILTSKSVTTALFKLIKILNKQVVPSSEKPRTLLKVFLSLPETKNTLLVWPLACRFSTNVSPAVLLTATLLAALSKNAVLSP